MFNNNKNSNKNKKKVNETKQCCHLSLPIQSDSGDRIGSGLHWNESWKSTMMKIGQFFKDFIYLFLEKEGKGERMRGRETYINCLSHAPSWGCGMQPRHVPRPGIKPVTFWFVRWYPTHWATPVREIWDTSLKSATNHFEPNPELMLGATLPESVFMGNTACVH